MDSLTSPLISAKYRRRVAAEDSAKFVYNPSKWIILQFLLEIAMYL